ncbi:MAG: protein kinase [Pyrinomonadaceae bacterium]
MVGLYTLIVKLGRGGFGEVWLAEKRSQFVTKKVAVKLPHEEQVNFDAIRQEATLWEQASGHPNVLPIIDADVYDGQVVIVSEYADGGSLADKLKREEKLSVKQAVEMTIGILNGLEFLHNRQIIHRDIKPQNILLQGNTPRLADFGISRAMQTTVVSSAIIGTDAYMSPEAFDGKRNAQTDIWSVGVVLYQLLKGSLPFPQEHPSERMFAVLTKEFEPLSNEVSSDVQRIVQKALAKLPENRYQNCPEMIGDLRKALTFIEHPTFAPTEILIKPNLTDYDTNAPTFATDEQMSAVKPSFIEPVAPTQPAYPPPNPTQPAVQQNSVVTQLNQMPFAKDISQPFQKQDLSGETGDAKNINVSRKRIAWGVTGVIIISFLLVIYAFTSIGLGKLTAFSSAGRYGYQDAIGKTVIPPKYEEAESFNNGLGRVMLNKKYGYINSRGVEVIPVKFDYVVYNFDGEYAVLALNGKKVQVDKNGKETVIEEVIR